MPLLKGSSDEVVGKNVKELMGSGRSQKQAVAIELSSAGRSAKKRKPGRLSAELGVQG